MITVTLCNSGGELDRRTAESPEAAVAAVVEMIEEAGELHDGDAIHVKED